MKGPNLTVALLIPPPIVRFFGGVDRESPFDPRGRSEEHSYPGH